MIDKLKKNFFILLSSFLVLYFLFNLFDGSRGLISFIEKKNNLNELNIEIFEVNKKIENLELKNSLLSDNLDLDYIEILIRDKFIYGKLNENIYMINNDSYKN